MITDDELKISNISYTNKDFVSIYPELLDLAKRISPRWDPTQTNESDPGLVLLKLLAFIGDKTNYNSDKNALECFLPSATQDKSVRMLCETNGYSPKYYQSATTDITFRYDGKKLTDGKYFKLPAFTTVVSDGDDEISYTLIESITVDKRKTKYSALAMQGTFTTLAVGDSERVHLSDLDDGNRVYLPEAMVAQNGVFVFGDDSEASDYTASWRRVDNLNVIAPSADEDGMVYKVGYDSEQGLPYVEFPDNISELIGNGLIVKYCITKGASGNVTAGALTKAEFTSADLHSAAGSVVGTIDFTTSEDITSDDSDAGTLVIKNVSSAINGADPETIDEAYNSFKKTVGTFDTLVSCKDYENAIYNLVDESTGYPYVSNAAVTDRRTDINYATSIVTFSNVGKFVVGGVAIGDSAITPYDLCLYPLQPMRASYTSDNYSNSFKPLSNTQMLKYDLDDLKTISHNYKDVSGAGIWAIKNYYGLNAVITTTSKVNDFEQAEIKSAVMTALTKAFNGRKVDYGYEIPFDSILKTIEGADSRIKSVSLDEPDVRPVIMDATGSEKSLFAAQNNVRNDYVEMLARNILAGKVRMFDYDDFVCDFGMSNLLEKSYKTTGIYKIQTNVNIPYAGGYADKYTLRENEVVQFIAPNVSGIITYPAYTNFAYKKFGADGKSSAEGTPCVVSPTTYKAPCEDFNTTQQQADETSWYFKLTKKDVYPAIGRYVDANGNLYEKATSSSNISGVTLYKLTALGTVASGIKKGEEHVIGSDESVVIQYTDSNSKQHAIVYSHDKVLDNGEDVTEENGYSTPIIIKPNFDMVPVTNYSVGGRSVIEKDGVKYYTLSTNEEIEVRGLVKRKITDSQLNCYWSTSSPDNALFSKKYRVGNGTSPYVYERLLGDNEYFAYTDSAKTEMVILQSGTKLRYETKTQVDSSEWTCDKQLISKLTENGFSLFEDFNWEVKAFNDNPLIVQDMQILTLSAGDKFKIDADVGSITDKWSDELPTTVRVTYDIAGGETGQELSMSSELAYSWRVRSRLDLNCGPNSKQHVLPGQSVTLYYNNDWKESASRSELIPSVEQSVTIEGAENTYITTNIAYSGVAGGEVDTIVSNISSEGTTYTLDLGAMYFKYEAPSYTGSDGVEHTLDRINGYISIPLHALGSTGKVKLPTLLSETSTEPTLIMAYLSCSDKSAAEVVAESSMWVKKYNDGTATTSSTVTLRSADSGTGSHPFILDYYGAGLTINFKTTDSLPVNLILGTPSRTKSLNAAFGLNSDEETALLNRLRELDKDMIFYYNLPESPDMVDVSDMSTASALWDRNNVYNRMTIGEIDFSKGRFNVSVARSSRK